MPSNYPYVGIEAIQHWKSCCFGGQYSLFCLVIVALFRCNSGTIHGDSENLIYFYSENIRKYRKTRKLIFSFFLSFSTFSELKRKNCTRHTRNRTWRIHRKILFTLNALWYIRLCVKVNRVFKEKISCSVQIQE